MKWGDNLPCVSIPGTLFSCQWRLPDRRPFALVVHAVGVRTLLACLLVDLQGVLSRFLGVVDYAGLFGPHWEGIPCCVLYPSYDQYLGGKV